VLSDVRRRQSRFAHLPRGTSDEGNSKIRAEVARLHEARFVLCLLLLRDAPQPPPQLQHARAIPGSLTVNNRALKNSQRGEPALNLLSGDLPSLGIHDARRWQAQGILPAPLPPWQCSCFGSLRCFSGPETCSWAQIAAPICTGACHGQQRQHRRQLGLLQDPLYRYIAPPTPDFDPRTDPTPTPCCPTRPWHCSKRRD
jgi:hypothetical protein